MYYATYDAGTGHRTNRVYAENNAALRSPSRRRIGTAERSTRSGDGSACNRLPGTEQTPLFTQGKYADGSAPIPVASYTEAQLILAEATGGPGAITILNTLRAGAGLCRRFASSSDPAVIKADIAQERARWLWLQGTHLVRCSPPESAARSSGRAAAIRITYSKGGNYGSETCMPIPAVETNNNPNANGGG